MQSVHERSMPLLGHRTRVLEVQGEGTGIVLLHGWGDSADTWRPLLDELASIGRRAIAVDLPGFGRASGLARGPLLPQLDEFAAALVLEWGAGEPVVVAGASLGGAVALRLAERPDLPIAWVMPVSPAGLEMPGWFDCVERDPIVRRLLDLPMPVPSALVRSLVGADARLDPRASQRDVVDAFAGDHVSRRSAAALLESGRGLLPELATAPFDLAAVACPVVLVWGSHDRLVPDSGARGVLDALPATRVELIEGCGRAPQLEAAGRLLELLVAFPA
jgi:pimeloyl-ACP methyl ester carboxylesterase